MATAREGSLVVLPTSHVITGSLCFKNPLVVRGAPGTLLEIKNGHILLDFSLDEEEEKLGLSALRNVPR